MLQLASYNTLMTLFFGEATMQNVKVIKAILRNFELASGLKINFTKSCFGAVGKSDQCYILHT